MVLPLSKNFFNGLLPRHTTPIPGPSSSCGLFDTYVCVLSYLCILEAFHHSQSYSVGALESMLPTFTSLLRLSQRTSPPVNFIIRAYYTRALHSLDPRPDQLSPIPDGLMVNAGRPPLSAVLDEFLNSTISSLASKAEEVPAATHGGHGVAIAICGPATLSADIRLAMLPPRAGGVVDKERRGRLGGVEVYEEYVAVFIVG